MDGIVRTNAAGRDDFPVGRAPDGPAAAARRAVRTQSEKPELGGES